MVYVTVHANFCPLEPNYIFLVELLGCCVVIIVRSIDHAEPYLQGKVTFATCHLSLQLVQLVFSWEKERGIILSVFTAPVH